MRPELRIPAPRGGPALAGLGAAVLDLALGSRCLLCQRGGALCCPWCRERLDRLVRVRPLGVVAHVGPSADVAVTAAVAYRPPLAAMVVGYKEHGALSLTPVLAGLLATALLAALNEDRGKVRGLAREAADDLVTVVPVPSRPGAVRHRGDAPTVRLARATVRRLRGAGVSARVVPVLASGRAVRDQAGLTAGQRRRNVRGSMTVRRRLLAGVQGTVVVVDDVITTGATLTEAVRALGAAGIPVAATAVVAATPPPTRRRPPR